MRERFQRENPAVTTLLKHLTERTGRWVWRNERCEIRQDAKGVALTTVGKQEKEKIKKALLRLEVQKAKKAKKADLESLQKRFRCHSGAPLTLAMFYSLVTSYR